MERSTRPASPAIAHNIERGVSLADSKWMFHLNFPRTPTATSGTQSAPTVSALLSCLDGFFAPCLSFAENTAKPLRHSCPSQGIIPTRGDLTLNDRNHRFNKV